MNYDIIQYDAQNIPQKVSCKAFSKKYSNTDIKNYVSFLLTQHSKTNNWHNSNIFAYLESACHIYTILKLLGYSQNNYYILAQSENFYQNVLPFTTNETNTIHNLVSNEKQDMYYYFYNNENYMLLKKINVDYNTLKNLLNKYLNDTNGTYNKFVNDIFNLFEETYNPNIIKSNRLLLLERYTSSNNTQSSNIEKIQLKDYGFNYQDNFLMNNELLNIIITKNNILNFVHDILFFEYSKITNTNNNNKDERIEYFSNIFNNLNTGIIKIIYIQVKSKEELFIQEYNNFINTCNNNVGQINKIRIIEYNTMNQLWKLEYSNYNNEINFYVSKKIYNFINSIFSCFNEYIDLDFNGNNLTTTEQQKIKNIYMTIRMLEYFDLS